VAGSRIGTCFDRQRPTGRIWHEGGATAAALILTRILVLQGLEDGVNLGGAVDTLSRGIYIHGTNCQAKLGTPASHGCIRMNFREVADLYAMVRPGDQILIAGGLPV
jgi:lipoprotein-anchoring transpeptidase ErfK/SrfK